MLAPRPSPRDFCEGREEKRIVYPLIARIVKKGPQEGNPNLRSLQKLIYKRPLHQSTLDMRMCGDSFLPSRLKHTKRSATMPYQHPQGQILRHKPTKAKARSFFLPQRLRDFSLHRRTLTFPSPCNKSKRKLPHNLFQGTLVSGHEITRHHGCPNGNVTCLSCFFLAV